MAVACRFYKTRSSGGLSRFSGGRRVNGNIAQKRATADRRRRRAALPMGDERAGHPRSTHRIPGGPAPSADALHRSVPAGSRSEKKQPGKSGIEGKGRQ